jgi:hypothetical protein
MKIAISLLIISWIWIIYEFINAPLIKNKEDETPNS